MQGPFNPQTDSVGFYVPLLGAASAAILHHRGSPPVRTKCAEQARSSAKPVSELDSNLPTYFAGTPARLHDEIFGVNRLIANLFTIFGVVAFLLSAVGFYGVMSFSVTSERRSSAFAWPWVRTRSGFSEWS